MNSELPINTHLISPDRERRERRHKENGEEKKHRSKNDDVCFM